MQVYLHLYTNQILHFSSCLSFIIQASATSSSLPDLSETLGPPISTIQTTVPAPSPSAEFYPRGCTRSSVKPADGSIEHRSTSMVAPHARLEDSSVPLQEADSDQELFSDHLCQNPRLILDANQLITPIDGTSESLDPNASQSNRLEESCIDLTVRGSGLDDMVAQVPVVYGNYEDCPRSSVTISQQIDGDLSSNCSDTSSKTDDCSIYSASTYVEKSTKDRSHHPPRRSARFKSSSSRNNITNSNSQSVSSEPTLPTKGVSKSITSLPISNCSFMPISDCSDFPTFNDILYTVYSHECTISKTPIKPQCSELLQTLDWSGVYVEVACAMCPSDFTREFYLITLLTVMNRLIISCPQSMYVFCPT